MILSKKRNRTGHRSLNIVSEANEGFSHISKNVERIIGPQMTELADASLRQVPGMVNTGTAVVKPAGQCQVLTNNIVEDIIPIIVTRNSYNIAATKLPFVLFAPVNFIEQYQSIFAFLQTMPTGVTVTCAVFQNRTVRFTYTSGLNIDTIDVTTDFAVSYPVILEMLKTDYFGAKGIKYTAGSNYDLQFNSFSLQGGRTSMFGLVDQKSVPVSSFKRADQQQNNIVNLDTTILINGRRYLALGMAATPSSGTSDTIKLDVFVTEYGSTTDVTGSSICR